MEIRCKVVSSKRGRLFGQSMVVFSDLGVRKTVTAQRVSSKTVDLDRPTLRIPRKLISDKPSTYYFRAGEGRDQVVQGEVPGFIREPSIRRLKYNPLAADVKGEVVFCLQPTRGA